MLTDSPLFYTNPQLISRVVKGDESAFRILFNQYWDHIYTVAFSFTKSEALSEELVQDIFLKVWTGREKLAGVDSFANYLFIIARNHILNQLRKKVYEVPFREEVLAFFTTDNNPEQRMEVKEMETCISRGISLLSQQQQAVYTMSRWEGLSHDEIAERLGISKNTVKTHMAKSLRFLREYLRLHMGKTLYMAAVLTAFL